MHAYRPFFGFAKEPFPTDLPLKDIMQTPELSAAAARFQYAVSIGGVALITGEIGSGKSTAVRFAQGELHPSEYTCLPIIATSGSIVEVYRQIAAAIGIERSTTSKALMTSLIRKEIKNMVSAKKLKPVLIIDEASLLRLEVFAELHTLLQFEQDSKAWLPLIMIGQASIIDKLHYRTTSALASRVIARCHLEGLDLDLMRQYLAHHLSVAGIRDNLFDDSAATAIHQASAGLLRKANHLARGALIAAAKDQSRIVSAEHVRLAATEIF
jgi:type II secretory pathway predicted ATPase ExeA